MMVMHHYKQVFYDRYNIRNKIFKLATTTSIPCPIDQVHSQALHQKYASNPSHDAVKCPPASIYHTHNISSAHHPTPASLSPHLLQGDREYHVGLEDAE